jgi:glycerol-3-phosphate acyltransferase PlsY
MSVNLLLIVGAYLLGSVSSAVIVCRVMGLPDPRSEGSSNPGATNVLRIGGKKAAAVTLLGDSLKGLVPMLIGHLLAATPAALAAIGLAAFLGHLYPLFFGFQGGKGVATALGVQFGLYWPIGLSVAVIWLFVAKVLKISSLSALVCMGLAPLIVWVFWFYHHGEGLLFVVGMQVIVSVLLFWRHRSNIQNLLSGKEEKLTDKPG